MKIFGKRTWVAMATTVTLFTGVMAPASANIPPYGERYNRYFTNGSFVATAKLDNSSIAVSETMTRPLNSTGPLGSLSSAVFNYYWGLQTDLGNMLAQQTAGTPFTAQGGVLNGPLNLAISSGAAPGYPAGTLKVSLSGLSYSFSASGSVSKAGIRVDCTDYINFNSIAISFYYNPITGAIVGADQPILNPTQSASCSSNIDFIPIVGDLADNYAESVVTKLTSGYLSKWGSQVVTGAVGVRFFGIENYIRPNQYVFNGFDAGAYLVNNLTTILQTSGTVYMSIGGPISDASYYDDGLYATLNTNVFKLGFTNQNHNFSFSLDTNANYTEKLVCLGGSQVNCPLPK